MQLSDESIEQFREKYYLETGEIPEHDEARSEAQNLMNLAWVVCHTLPDEEGFRGPPGHPI